MARRARVRRPGRMVPADLRELATAFDVMAEQVGTLSPAHVAENSPA